jgi:putative hemolysin
MRHASVHGWFDAAAAAPARVQGAPFGRSGERERSDVRRERLLWILSVSRAHERRAAMPSSAEFRMYGPLSGTARELLYGHGAVFARATTVKEQLMGTDSAKYCRVARTQADVDAAQRVRYRCIANELNIAVELDGRVGREISAFDNLETTHHLLLYCGQNLIGTARLALLNPDVADASGTDLGFELEHEFDLAGLSPIGHGLAEVARLCILEPWRRTSASLRLYEGLYCLSRELGVSHWIGAADCQTSRRDEARAMRVRLENGNFIHETYQVKLRQRARSELGPRAGGALVCGVAGESSATVPPGSHQMASTLATFTRRLGAQCLGEPSLHPAFPRYVMPMLVTLDELPRSTLSLFDLSLLAPSLPEPRLHSAVERRDETTRRMAS